MLEIKLLLIDVVIIGIVDWVYVDLFCVFDKEIMV